jgi:serine phosphatase RsbU (regulator of sigma subunit)
MLGVIGRLGAEALRNAHVFARLKQRVKGVTSLYRVGRTISSSLDLGHLLELILSALRDVVPYHAAGIYLLEETKLRLKAVALRGYRPEMEAAAMAKLGDGLIGWAANEGEDLLVGDVSQDEHYINARDQTRSEMVALLRRGQRIVGAFNVESDLLHAYTRSDLMLLKAFASQAAVAVDNATLYEDALEKRRLDDELSLARSIQKRLLPSTAPHVDGWEIAGLNVPAARVGGDYYDFIDVSDGVTGISIADVSGKGVPAALVMATFRASLLAEILNEYSIETILHKVNELLVRSTEPPVFVTAVYGTLETRKGMFTYCNAGHLPPLLIPAQGEPHELQGSDLLLGSFSSAAYNQRIVDLTSGDVLILYTDGITEAMGRQDEEFGTERLAKIAAAHRAGPAVEIRDRLYAEAVEFAADPTVLDDMTAVVIKRL